MSVFQTLPLATPLSAMIGTLRSAMSMFLVGQPYGGARLCVISAGLIKR
jgi:hypothetical protein